MTKKIVFSIIAFFCVVAVLLTCFFDFLYKKAESSLFTMGTVASFTCYGKCDMVSLQQICQDVELVSSVKIENSDASELNKTKSSKNVMLIQQAKLCKEIFENSDGSFDFSILPVASLWNIGSENPSIPEEEAITEALTKVSSYSITVTDDTVRLGEDQSVDFGGIAKGYACDRIISALKNSSCKGGIISVGGSIGTFGNRSLFDNSYRIAVKNPFDTEKYAGYFTVNESFISTSGDYERFFEQNGVRYHHIIDPKTGKPAQSDVSSVTVIADSGALSDALSTACFVLGSEKSASLLKKYNAKGIFIFPDKTYKLVGEVDFTPSEDFCEIH